WPTATPRMIVRKSPSSATDSPALSARNATTMLSRGDSRITACSARPLELAIAVISLDGVHPADERAAHFAFRGDNGLGLGDDGLGERLRNDHDAVAIAEQVVAGRDGHAADRDGL